MLRYQVAQLVDERLVPAEPQLDLVAPLHRVPPALVQPQRLGRMAGERRSAPEAQRLGQQARLLGRVLGTFRLPGLRPQPIEPDKVEGARLDPDRVAAGHGPHQRAVAEGVAQAHHVRLQRGAGAVRRILAPQPVDQVVRGDGFVGAHQQHREQQLLFGRTQLDRSALVSDLKRPEHAELPPDSGHGPHCAELDRDRTKATVHRGVSKKSASRAVRRQQLIRARLPGSHGPGP
nr:hypothetical protein [Kutzneria sp. 744]